MDFGDSRRNRSEICFESVNEDWQNQVLVIVANRFGISHIPTEYFPLFKRFMKLNCFTGMIGGKPGLAYYFCGFVEKGFEDSDPLNQLMFLDPHIVRDNSKPYVCGEIRTLHM